VKFGRPITDFLKRDTQAQPRTAATETRDEAPQRDTVRRIA